MSESKTPKRLLDATLVSNASTSTNSAVPVFSGTSGTVIQNSAVTITGGGSNILTAAEVDAGAASFPSLLDGANGPTLVSLVGGGGNNRYIEIQGTSVGATGTTGPTLTVNGTNTNTDLNITAKGTGTVNISKASLVTPALGTPASGVMTNVTGTAASLTAGNATKLTTARTVQTDLTSTTSASFDGSSNITPGVSGTLAVTNGGTGTTTSTGTGAVVLGTRPTLAVTTTGLSIQDATDNTKVLNFNLTNLTTATTKTVTIPNANGIMAYTNQNQTFTAVNTFSGNNLFTGTVQTFNAASLAIKGATSGTTTLSASAVAGTTTATLPGTSGNIFVDAATQTNTAAKTFNSSTLLLAGATSGTTILNAAAAAGSGTVTLPVSGTILSTTTITSTSASITTSFTTASTTAVQITGLSVTFTAVGARPYKISVWGQDIYNTAVSGQTHLSIWQGTVGTGTQVANTVFVAAAAGQGSSATAVAIVTPSAGSVTYNAGLKIVAAGTGGFEAFSTAPGFILVEPI